MVCDGQTSRFEVATELLKLLNLSSEITLTPVSSDYFKKLYFAPRPSSERLINRKLTIRNLNFMRDWKVALKDYINDHYSDYYSSTSSKNTTL